VASRYAPPYRVPPWQVTVTDAAMIRTFIPPISEVREPLAKRRSTGGWRVADICHDAGEVKWPVWRVVPKVTVPRIWPETAATSSQAAWTASRIR